MLADTPVSLEASPARSSLEGLLGLGFGILGRVLGNEPGTELGISISVSTREETRTPSRPIIISRPHFGLRQQLESCLASGSVVTRRFQKDNIAPGHRMLSTFEIVALSSPLGNCSFEIDILGSP